MRDEEEQRDDPAEQLRQPAVDDLAACTSRRCASSSSVSFGSSTRVVVNCSTASGRSPRACLSVPRIELIADRHLGDCAVLQQRLELAVGDRPAGGRQEVHLRQPEHAAGTRARTTATTPGRAPSGRCPRRSPPRGLRRGVRFGAGHVNRARIHYALTACASSNVSPSSPASTTTVSPSPNSPSSTRSASGSSTRR